MGENVQCYGNIYSQVPKRVYCSWQCFHIVAYFEIKVKSTSTLFYLYICKVLHVILLPIKSLGFLKPGLKNFLIILGGFIYLYFCPPPNLAFIIYKKADQNIEILKCFWKLKKKSIE